VHDLIDLVDRLHAQNDDHVVLAGHFPDVLDDPRLHRFQRGPGFLLPDSEEFLIGHPVGLMKLGMNEHVHHRPLLESTFRGYR
jgi:hypothetical protein